MHFVLQAININCNSILQLTNQKILSPYKIYSVHTPEVSPHTIECVICVFGLVLDLVLVFVGFGLFQICFPFHAIAKTTLFIGTYFCFAWTTSIPWVTNKLGRSLSA